MLLNIIRKELLDHFLSLRFAVACLVCLVVSLLSSVLLVRDFRDARATYHFNRMLHHEEVLERTGIWSLSEGTTVDRPLNSMNILVRGLGNELTESIRVESHGRLQFAEVFEQNPVVPLFPEVDFVFIVGIIMSLLALAFSHDAVSGERQSGVLKLVMSHSVPRGLLLAGKWIGGYTALVVPFLVAFVGGLAVLGVAGEEMGTDEVAAFLATIFVALLYLAGIYSLGLFFSCRTDHASTSITVLLLVWAALVLAVPNLAPHVASRLLPVPSRQSIDREKAAVDREADRRYQEFLEAEQARAGRHDVWNDEEIDRKLKAAYKELHAEVHKVEESYAAKVQAQTRWSGIIARLSPLTSFNLAALGLGAAGIEQERVFVDGLKKYSTTWAEYEAEKSSERDRLQEEIGRRVEAGQDADDLRRQLEQFENMDFSDYPRFEFQYMSLRERLSLVYADVLLLILWGVLFFLLAFVSFLRHDLC